MRDYSASTSDLKDRNLQSARDEVKRLSAELTAVRNLLFVNVIGHPEHHPSWGCPDCKKLRALIEGKE